MTLIEGSSSDKAIVNQIKSLIKPRDTVLVILDSNHSKSHVLEELEAYHDLVTPGSYLVATDGVMKELSEVPRGALDWQENNPTVAALECVQRHPEFVVEQPSWPFNESQLTENIVIFTYCCTSEG